LRRFGSDTERLAHNRVAQGLISYACHLPLDTMHGADAKPNLTRHLADADSGVVVGWFCGGISEDRYELVLK
jgi:hypothetical protein